MSVQSPPRNGGFNILSTLVIIAVSALLLFGAIGQASAADFDQTDEFGADFGNWSNVAGDNYDWTRGSATPTSSTGPQSGDQGADTSFVFTEGSGTTAGQTFYLESNDLDAGSYALSVSFYWHMYGANIGSLHLDVWNGSSWDPDAWSLSGDAGNTAWTQQTVDLAGAGYTSGTIKLRFRGVSGGIRSDMALDTIRIFGDLSGGGGAPSMPGLALYGFPDGSESATPGRIAPSGGDAGLTLGDLTNGATNIYQVTNAGYATSPELRLGPQATTLAGAVAADSYVKFSFAPNSGKEVDIISLTFKAARGGAGTPSGWGLRSNLDGYAADIDSAVILTARTGWTDVTVDLSGAQYQNLTGAVTFRIYVYSPLPTDTVELDEITLNVAVADLPGGGGGGGAGSTVLDSSGFDGSVGAYWTAADNGATNSWTIDANQTPSNNVGPSGPRAGSSYIYTEASSSKAGDEWYLTSSAIDADLWDPTLNFWYNKYHNTFTTCNLQVQVSTDGGGVWDTPLWSTNIDQGAGGANGGDWLNQAVDLSAYSGSINVRFKASSGGKWQCDTALDSVVVSAVPACVSSTGPPIVNSIKVNGDPIDVCDAIDMRDSDLLNITIDNGGPDLYDGSSCADIDASTGWPTNDPSYVNLNLTVTGEDNCGFSQVGSGVFEYSACVSSTGPLEIPAGGVLSGATASIDDVVKSNGATLNTAKVWEVTGVGADIDDTEGFDGGGLEGWGSNWIATEDDGVTLQSSPSGNGDLATGFFTRSEKTGPAAPLDGDFIYFEASGGALTDRYLVNRTLGGSDILYDAGNNALLASFKYLLNGSDVGNLSLEVKNPNYNGGVWTEEWIDGGNKGDNWNTGSVDLGAGGGLSATAYAVGNTQIRFRFTWGGGNLGDIALDAVRVLGPRAVDPTALYDGTGAAAANISTAGWPDGGAIRVDVTGTNNCGSALSASGFATFESDGAVPVMAGFILPGRSTSPVRVLNMAATDNIGVSGYLITETPAPPSATAPGWTGEAPLTISTASLGSVTFYGWAKDSARNVSASLSQTVTVDDDVTAPTVDNFNLPAIAFSPIIVNAFVASDDSGHVTGYMITESPTAPLPGAGGWLGDPPSTFTTAAGGSTTFYAWAKDEGDNVSAALTQSVDVKVDTNGPTVSFALPATHDSYLIPITTFLAGDTDGGTANNTGVAAYKITTDATAPNADDSGWLGVAPATLSVTADGAHSFWGWAKDNSANVSAGVRSDITITLPPTCDFEVDMAGTLVQTENYTNMGTPDPWAWDTIMTPLADSNGDLSSGGYIITATGGTGSTPNGSRADYPLFFTTSGTYCIWIRGLDEAGRSGGDSNFWGVDGAPVGAMTESADNQWAWTNGTQNGQKCAYISGEAMEDNPKGSGSKGEWHTINLWPREDGQKNDMFLLTTSTSATAGGLFSGNNDQSTLVPGVSAIVDPTCVDSSGGGAPGGGAGSGDFIHIDDDQLVIGSPVDIETLYTSNKANPLQYRAMGAQSDGFEHFSIDPKWYYTNIGGDAMDPDAVERVEGQGVLKMTGSGADIWGSIDYFPFSYQAGVSGDFSIDLNVRKLIDRATGTTASQNAGAKAGIMVRQSLATNSRNLMMQVTSGAGARLQRRATDGGATAYVNGANGVTAGIDTWLRLTRSGSSFEGFYSSDNGASWTSTGSTSVNMTGDLVIGLGVTSHNTSRDSVATFDNFLFMPRGPSNMKESWTGTATGLDTSKPTPWLEGRYAIAVRDGSVASGSAYQVNSINYNPCVDGTPSTLTIKNAAITGAAVSLNSLFDYTGNPTGFSYEINGNSVLNPWNSYGTVPTGTNADVIFRVSASDLDCSGSTVSATGTVTVDNTCPDTSPSTITIRTGQITGGSAVDLTDMFTSTGNVAIVGFTYKVDGAVIGDPAAWDSRAYGIDSAESVTLEVLGVDPDCGNKVSGINSISIDNTCVRNAPSLAFSVDDGHVGAGRGIPYQVTIRNEDSPNCGPSTFAVDVIGQDNLTDFDVAFFNPSGANEAIVLQGRESATIELALSAKTGATEWNTSTATLEVSSSYADVHHTPKTSDSILTTVFLVSPITHSSVTTNSAKWGGETDADGNTHSRGSWGTSKAGSKYGNFDCLLCHEKGGPNIKWMRGSVTTPDGSAWGESPNAAVTHGVEFKDAQPGSADWGDDDPGGDDEGEAAFPGGANGSVGRTGSTRVCEVCHSVTMYHRFDTEDDPSASMTLVDADGSNPVATPIGPQAEYNHFAERDCTDCHRHSLGFTAGCQGCHGNPPLEATLGGPSGLADIPGATGSTTPGTHYKHVSVLGFPCEYCHSGWREPGEMPKEVGGQQQINHTFNAFFDLGITDPGKDNGHYTGQDGLNYEPNAEAIADGHQNADGTIIAGQGTLTCESIYCHGGTETMGGTNPQWNGNVTCNACHGTSAKDTPPGYSHTTHVAQRGLACTECHAVPEGKQPGYNGHVNGRIRIDLSGLPDSGGAPTYNGINGSYVAATVYESNTDGSDLPPSAVYGTCSNIACHYGVETPVWNAGEPAVCTTCHNDTSESRTDFQDPDLNGAYTALGTAAEKEEWIMRRAAPSSGNHQKHVNPDSDGNGIHERMIGTYLNMCENCHGGGANNGEHEGHIDFKTSIGGGMTYDGSTCTSVCHDARHITWGSAQPLSCEACHMAPYLGPTVVDPDNEGTGLPTTGYGSHLKATKSQSLDSDTDWRAQCRMCHPYHVDEAGITVVEIPQPDAAWDQLGDGTDMAYQLGLQFPVSKGIHLGGTAIDNGATTEAEMCWNCHDDLENNVSEWGVSNNAMTGGMIYDYGSVDTSDWTSAVWTSGEASFGYKTAAIRSTHAANVSVAAGQATGSGIDDVGGIRCTYCHDVHDLNKAIIDVNTGATEVMSGQPYLRGRWMGNPYKEDGAPQAGTAYTNFGGEDFGQVPRASNDSSQKMGGYWIDQNSGDPFGTASLLTYDDFGGLCQLCHGAGIDTLNQYGAQGAGWVSGYNGHANSVKGGSGAGGVTARNIFNDTDRGGGSINNYNGSMGYWGFQEPGDGGGGMRGGDGDSFNITPGVDGYGNEPCANDGGSCNGGYINMWDDLRTFTVRGTSTGSPDNNYHSFSCSKCHNPHASRLPKLMITNCLDTKQNQWDNNVQAGIGGPTVTDNTSASNFTTAQNCHRIAGDDPMDTNDSSNGKGSGWNLVTPWTDGDADYNTTGDKTQDNSGTW